MNTFSRKAAQGAVQARFHILNYFDIPVGATGDKVGKTSLYDTIWYTVAADTRNRQYYFHTHYNRLIRVIDLTKIALDAKDTVSIPMKGKEDNRDLTPSKK
jgi:choloylglycine hydrolase